MKLLLLLFLISPLCFGAQSVIRDASVTNVPTAYTTAGAELMSDVKEKTLCCLNNLGATIRLCLSSNTAAACSDDWYMQDGAGFCFVDAPLADSVWVKSEGVAIVTGILSCRAL